MKKIVQKSILIGIGYYLLVLVNACCNCNGIKHKKYRFTAIYTQNNLYTFVADSMSYTISNADTFRKGTYCFELHFDYQLLAGAGLLPLVNSAYACKCALDSFKANTSVDKVTIRTVYDFDGQHPAGSDVTDLFYYIQFAINPHRLIYRELHSRLAYLSHMESGAQALYIPCFLKSDPAEGSRMQFEVTVVYLDKTVHKTISKPVIIQ